MREPRAGQQGTMPSTTWSLALLPQLECPSQRSLSGCPGRTGSNQTALHSSVDGAGSHCVGMLQWFALWSSPMLMELLRRRFQQCMWLRRVRKRNMHNSTANIFMSWLQWRPLMFSIPQSTACWRRLAWGFFNTVSLGRPVSYTSAF